MAHWSISQQRWKSGHECGILQACLEAKNCVRIKEVNTSRENKRASCAAQSPTSGRHRNNRSQRHTTVTVVHNYSNKFLPEEHHLTSRSAPELFTFNTDSKFGQPNIRNLIENCCFIPIESLHLYLPTESLMLDSPKQSCDSSVNKQFHVTLPTSNISIGKEDPITSKCNEYKDSSDRSLTSDASLETHGSYFSLPEKSSKTDPPQLDTISLQDLHDAQTEQDEPVVNTKHCSQIFNTPHHIYPTSNPPQTILIPPHENQATPTNSRPEAGKAAVFKEEYDSFKVEWNHIQRMRLEIWSLRSQVHETRSILREKQAAKSRADDNYMMRLNEDEFGIFVREGSSSSLSDLRNNCREIRNEYGPLEDDCNDLEDRLGNEEFQLTRVEQRFYMRWHFPPASEIGSNGPHVEHDPRILCTNVDLEETMPSYHPRVTEYLSKLGDFEILKERLQDFVDEKEALEREKRSREKFDMTLDSEDEVWLDNSEMVGQAIYEELKRSEKTYLELRTQCLADGFIDRDGEPVKLRGLEKIQFKNEHELNANNQDSEYVKFPLLLPVPGANFIQSQISDHGSNSDQESVNE